MTCLDMVIRNEKKKLLDKNTDLQTMIEDLKLDVDKLQKNDTNLRDKNIEVETTNTESLTKEKVELEKKITRTFNNKHKQYYSPTVDQSWNHHGLI